MKKILLVITSVVCLVFTACHGGNLSNSVEESTYSISVDGIFEHNCGLVTLIEMNVFECNESGAVIYENRCTFETDDIQDYVAHAGATIIKVFVEMNYLNLSKSAFEMKQCQTGWLPMSYALISGENKSIIVNKDTYLSQIQP